MKLTLTLIACILTVYGGYELIMSILVNGGSMLLVAGAILVVAGILALIENKVVTSN